MESGKGSDERGGLLWGLCRGRLGSVGGQKTEVAEEEQRTVRVRGHVGDIVWGQKICCIELKGIWQN